MTLALYILFDLVSLIFLFMYLESKKVNLINNNVRKGNKIYLLLSFLVMTSLVVFRSSSVGMDYTNVANSFQRIANGNELAYDVDWFGMPLVYICKIFALLISDNVVLFYGIIGIATLFILYKSLLKNSEKPVMSLFIFISFCLYYQMFNQSRQMLAIVIILYSFEFIKERKFLKYLIVVLLATAIHNTAIIMLPMYFISKININFKNILLYSGLALFIFFGSSLLEFLISKTNYAIYLTTAYNLSFTSSTLLNLGFRCILLIFCLIFYKNIVIKKPYAKYLYNLVIICTLLQFAAVQFYFLARLTTYFYIFYILLLPIILEEIYVRVGSKRKRQFIFLLVIAFFSAYHLFYYNSSSGAVGAKYENYSTIFTEG